MLERRGMDKFDAEEKSECRKSDEREGPKEEESLAFLWNIPKPPYFSYSVPTLVAPAITPCRNEKFLSCPAGKLCLCEKPFTSLPCRVFGSCKVMIKR